VAAKEITVKKYVVRLSVAERTQLTDLIHKCKRSAQLLTKVRILLKADVSEAGEGWSDSRIAEALDTSIANILRTRRQLVEEGFEAVLTEGKLTSSKWAIQLEAAAHVRVQAEMDRMAAEGRLPEPASVDFVRQLHRDFYRNAPEAMLRVKGAGRAFLMAPGEWRSRPEHDVAAGRHLPPSSDRVADFMAHFADRYRFDRLGKAARIMAIPAAHHRLNYIHPFPDGNGRVGRLMSHAMAHLSGIGAHGLWSISRGLARGIESRGEYKRMMDHADMPRQGDLDGRGNLSQRALTEFILWFLRVCLDQVTFMSGLFEIDTLTRRLRTYVERDDKLKPEAARLLEEALVRGEFDRGEVSRIAGLPERTARRLLNDLIATGLLASDTPKGTVSLRFPMDALEILLPRLFAET
jgi:Fic family protein